MVLDSILQTKLRNFKLFIFNIIFTQINSHNNDSDAHPDIYQYIDDVIGDIQEDMMS